MKKLINGLRNVGWRFITLALMIIVGGTRLSCQMTDELQSVVTNQSQDRSVQFSSTHSRLDIMAPHLETLVSQVDLVVPRIDSMAADIEAIRSCLSAANRQLNRIDERLSALVPPP